MKNSARRSSASKNKTLTAHYVDKVRRLKKAHPNHSATNILRMTDLSMSLLPQVKKALDTRRMKLKKVLKPWQVKKIWRLHQERRWGYRKIAKAIKGVGVEHRGAVEHVLRGRSWTKNMPDPIKPTGFIVNDRGSACFLYEADNTDLTVVIGADGIAKSRDVRKVYLPAGDYHKLDLRGFWRIFSHFKIKFQERL